MTRESSPAGTIEAAYPLTALQEGMLYHTIREPGSGAYLTQYTATLKGPLQPSVFRQAWALAAGRHEPFRTFFTWNTRERPLQVVRRQVDLGFAELDWVGQPREEQHGRWEALRAEDLRRGLDIGVAPVMRFTLVRVDRDEWWFLWLVYHALLDGWSGRMVLTEVYDDYARLTAGEDTVRQAGARFGDFVGWIHAQTGAEPERYWRSALADLRAPTPLPGAGSHATTASARAWSRSVRHLPSSLASEVDRTARECRVTLSSVVLAAWGLLLARHAEASDVVFGLTLTVRPPDLPGVQTAAGLYLNTLPLRLAIDPGARVIEWLADVQARQSGLRECDSVSLADVQRWSPVPAGQPLFDSLVALERFPERITSVRTFGTLHVQHESIVEHSNYPLALLVTPGDGIDLTLIGDAARYDSLAADRLLARYARILASLAASPRGTVAEMVMLPDDEERNLATWSVSSAPHPDETDVLDRFERIAAERPAADALVSADTRLSYGEVNLRASALAQRLIERGAGPGTLVGVLLDRSPEFIIAMLAALKAGAAYAPLDVHAPLARTTRILDQLSAQYGAGSVLLVMRGGQHPQLVARAHAVDLDVPDLDCRQSAASSRPDPKEAAYVIFTSGSTGTPKGVVVERRQLAWSTGARLAYYRGEVSRFLLLSPIAVDSATAGIYWTLCTGGALVLPPHRVEQDPQRLWVLIEREQVSHVLLIPSLYRALLDAAADSRAASVECIVVAGEACSADVVRLHHEKMGSAELHNEYGPSEGTVWATVDRLRPGNRVTIGRPVPGARVYVLDRARRRAPIGVAGEIAIGGAGVARGYVGDASLTPDRFAADPFVPGVRLYLTGDRGRVLPDGRIEFLGRIDDQIKIRGHRVEPGEIERRLESHPAVREAVVVSSVALPSDESLADALLELGEAGALACLESL